MIGQGPGQSSVQVQGGGQEAEFRLGFHHAALPQEADGDRLRAAPARVDGGHGSLPRTRRVAQLIPRQASEMMGRPLDDMMTTKEVSSVESGEVGFREITRHGVIDTSGI